jgi:hypothetical protein
VTDEHPGTDELGQRLEAYASARLAPRPGVAARIRASVIEEARMRSLEASLARPRGIFQTRRRLASVLLAAALTLAGAATVAAASSAGGPLYGARVWIESALLPANTDARALERIHQIDERILEVERAAQSGDSTGVAAAISAYREAVAAALDEVGADADRLAHLKAALGLHVTVLETLTDVAPSQAIDGINGAIDSSQKAVDKIEKTPPDTKPQPGSTGAPERTAAPHPTPGRSPAH